MTVMGYTGAHSVCCRSVLLQQVPGQAKQSVCRDIRSSYWIAVRAPSRDIIPSTDITNAQCWS